MDQKVESLFALEGGGAKVEKMAVEKREIIQWVRKIKLLKRMEFKIVQFNDRFGV